MQNTLYKEYDCQETYPCYTSGYRWVVHLVVIQQFSALFFFVLLHLKIFFPTNVYFLLTMKTKLMNNFEFQKDLIAFI